MTLSHVQSTVSADVGSHRELRKVSPTCARARTHGNKPVASPLIPQVTGKSFGFSRFASKILTPLFLGNEAVSAAGGENC
jgi:hypothetical protein